MHFYFAHISYTEICKDGKDPVVYREGSLNPEIAVLNLPLGPGDTIQTTDSRQCEIQFDTGTLVRMDKDTSLKIETVLAGSLSSQKKLTNLLLHKGHIYVMYKRYKRGEVFQIITPNTAIKMDHNSVGFVNAKNDGSTDVQIKEGKGHVMYGPDEKNLEKKKLKKHMTLTVSPDDTVARGAYERDTGFELWNEGMNKEFVSMHKGVTAIPEPIYKYPKSVIYFAQKYSNRYGEWKWSPLYGFVWKPYYSRNYPTGEWQPYMHGSWTSFDNQLFWVPEEPWGWAPYHLGVWMWDKDIGWIWIPGDAFAPAWVTWEFCAGYYMWKPWSMYDWYYSSLNYSRYGYYGDPWSYYPDYGQVPLPGQKAPLRTIKKEQLKDEKRTGIPQKPPKTIRRIYNNFVKTLERNDAGILASIEEIPNQIVVVTGKDLNTDAIGDKRIRLGEIPFQQIYDMGHVRQEVDAYRSAYSTFQKNEVIRSVANSVFSGEATLESRTFREADYSSVPLSPPESDEEKGTLKEQISVPKTSEKLRTSAPDSGALKIGSIISDSKIRFRDWNPDVSYARRNGMTIRYSSRTNEVHCPDLDISSRGVVARSSRIFRVVNVDSDRSFFKPSFSTSWSTGATDVSDSSSESSSSSSKEASSSSGTKKKN
jgi:hypothetical protein